MMKAAMVASLTSALSCSGPPEPPLITFIGDSITYGTVPDEGKSYVDILREKCTAVEINNIAVGGTQTIHWHPSNYPDGFPGTIHDIPLFRYIPASNVVVVALGTNDIQGWVDPLDVGENTYSILSTLQRRGVKDVILLPAFGPAPGLDFTFWEETVGYQKLACHLLSGCKLLDTELPSEVYPEDPIHPTAAGHAIIAARLYEVLKKIQYCDE
jgi:lysophospholipase L1-like esterase